jgi:DNA-binding PadR family transcriptional regulator
VNISSSLASSGPGPLSETTFFILTSISKEPIHGYGIIKDVQQLSDGRVRLATGTLYGALKRMLEAGWIKRRERNSTGGRDIIEYSLTPTGRTILHSEGARITELAQIVHEFGLAR